MSETTSLIHEIILQNFMTSEFPVNVWICALSPLVPPIHQELWSNGTHYVQDTTGIPRVGAKISLASVATGFTVPITETWVVKPLQVIPVIPPETRIIRVVVRNFIDETTENEQ